MRNLFLIALSILVISCTGTNTNSTNNTTTQQIKEKQIIKGPKRRIAVANFVDKSQNSWYKHDLGDGMADMLTTELFKTNNFIVVERTNLKSVMQEQKLALSGIVESDTAIEVGKIIGADVIITGTVTEFGIKESGGKIRGGFVNDLSGGLVNSVGIKTYTSRVAVDIRMIDATTGEVILAETASADKSSGKISLSSYNLPSIKLGSSKFDSTLVGKVTRLAIENVVYKIQNSISKNKWKGLILKSEGSEIWINSGSDANIKAGMKFSVLSKSESITDADGNNFVIPGKEIAAIEIIQVLPKLSKVKVISGDGIKKDMEVVEKIQ